MFVFQKKGGGGEGEKKSGLLKPLKEATLTWKMQWALAKRPETNVAMRLSFMFLAVLPETWRSNNKADG